MLRNVNHQMIPLQEFQRFNKIFLEKLQKRHNFSFHLSLQPDVVVLIIYLILDVGIQIIVYNKLSSFNKLQGEFAKTLQFNLPQVKIF